MSELVFTVLIAVFVGGFCYIGGKEVGHQEYHRGEIACQQMLSGALDCIRKDRVKP